MTLVFVALVCVGSVRLGKYLLGVRKTAHVNAQLAEIYEEQPSTEIEVPRLTDPASAPAEEADEERTEDAEEADVEPEDPDVGFHTAEGEVIESFKTLYAQNHDVAAWLKLPGVFSLPVVYRDNEYYLTHNFYGQESDSGTLFLDEWHPLEPQSQYLIIHGHAMYDGSMFGYLTHYRHGDYIKAHPRLSFTTMYEQEIYEIIGVLDVTEEEMISVVRLGKPQFDSEEEFADFVSGLRSKALHFTDQEIASDDALLALSTCWKDGRIVVFFRRVE